MTLVSNATLRKKFLESGMTPQDVARYLGWESHFSDGRTRPDGSRVTRVLGITRKNGRLQEQLSVDVAKSIGEVLGFDPVDLGF